MAASHFWLEPFTIRTQIAGRPLYIMAHEAEPTIISAIMLSDLAIVEQGTQKRSLIGTFDQFAFHQFPAQYGRFFITASITNVEDTVVVLVDGDEIGKRDFGVIQVPQ